MVKYYDPALDATFAALADPTRRAILARLAAGEASVTTLAEPFHVSLPAVSKHLRVLQRAGLLARKKQGRVHRCRLSPEPLKDAAEWVAFYRPFWEEQLDALARFLTETQSAGEKEGSECEPAKRSRDSRSKSRARTPHRRKKPSTRGRSPRP